MRKIHLILLLAAATLGFSACETLEKITGDPGEGVNFAIDFQPSGTMTTAGAELFANETNLTQLYVAVFDASGIFKQLVQPVATSEGNYRFGLAPGGYKLILTANLDMSELAKEFVQGQNTSAEYLRLISTSAPGKDRVVPMVSDITSLTRTGEAQDLGKIALTRLQARIDVVSNVPGLKILKVALKNQATQGVLDVNQQIAGTAHYSVFSLDELTVGGSPLHVGAVAGSIYSYPNADVANKTEMTVTYYDPREAVEKDEVVLFEKLERNKLYTLQFSTLESGLAYSVGTWNEGLKKVLYYAPATVLNSGLGIANFAKADVHEIIPTTSTVTMLKEGDTSWYQNRVDATAGTYEAVNPDSKPLFRNYSPFFETDVYSDENGVQWRVPTGGELTLLAPSGSLNFNGAREDQLNVAESLPDLFGIAGSGGQGSSDFRFVQSSEGGSNELAYTVYAVRFRNTAQCAAYRYRVLDFGQRSGRLTIRVKAYDTTAAPYTLDEVSREAFWTDGYLELVFPLFGNSQESNGNRGTHGSWWGCNVATDTGSPDTSTYHMLSYSSGIGMQAAQAMNVHNLRMVRKL